MPIWQIALAALVAAWALQAVGTFFQMRHYRSVMGELSRTCADGYLGAGNARASLGKGVVLLLVVGPDRVVRRLFEMRGRSVFARFASIAEAEGRPLEALAGAFPADKARGRALHEAMRQIGKAAGDAT